MENTSVCYNDAGGAFRSVKDPLGAIEFVNTLPTTDTWFGVNPVSVLTHGRGTAKDVTRLAALPADLDFKESGCGTPEIAVKIIEDLAASWGPDRW